MSTTQVPVSGNLPDPTSNATAQANILLASQNNIAILNAGLVSRYHGAYADYVANMRSGGFVPPERQTPPPVPLAWELAPPDADGYVFYQVGAAPVCAALPPVDYLGGLTVTPRSPTTIHVGPRIGVTKWFSVGPTDGYPDGSVTPPTTSDDGVTGVFQKYDSVIGGWYLLVG